MRDPVQVEILTFEGCPNAEPAVALVERIVDELDPGAVVQRVDVADPEDAARRRFLGSPTIRVDGRDVEPGAGERSDYVFACRIYRTDHGLSGMPDEIWIRDAIARR
jgi:hypothetical protein